MGLGYLQEASWLESELTNIISILTELVCVMRVTIPIFVFKAIFVCTCHEKCFCYPFDVLLYALLNCQGHIEGGDGDRMVDRNLAPTHLPKQWCFYIQHHIDWPLIEV